jgi:predicted TIM-barrel fold metal-dependent hydrolase
MTIDAHAYVGPWAFRHLAHAEPDALLRRLDRAGVEQALVSATEGILFKDPLSANRPLAARLPGREDRLRPLATLNPALPGWEADWETTLAELRPRGLRLHPGHHGYSPADPEAGRLIDAATRAALPVFVVVRIEDERVHHPLARVQPVTVAALAACVRARPSARFVLCGVRLAEVSSLLSRAPGASNYAVDVSHLQHPLDALDRLRELLPAERIWLGSGAPFLMPEAALYKVAMARLSEPEREAILSGNAARALRGGG